MHIGFTTTTETPRTDTYHDDDSALTLSDDGWGSVVGQGDSQLRLGDGASGDAEGAADVDAFVLPPHVADAQLTIGQDGETTVRLTREHQLLSERKIGGRRGRERAAG